MTEQVPYTESLLEVLADNDWDIIVLIKEAEQIKSQFDTAKQDLTIKKANLLLTTNWNEVNAQRVEEGLPKISNESMRKAYIDLKVAEKKLEVNALETAYETVQKILTYYMGA